MYVLICKRVVKTNTGATAQYSPRTANHTSLEVSGPFLSMKAAQAAVVAVLATHTCLNAQVWSEAQILAEAAALAGRAESFKDTIRAAERLLAARPLPAEAP